MGQTQRGQVTRREKVVVCDARWRAKHRYELWQLNERMRQPPCIRCNGPQCVLVRAAKSAMAGGVDWIDTEYGAIGRAMGGYVGMRGTAGGWWPALYKQRQAIIT